MHLMPDRLELFERLLEPGENVGDGGLSPLAASFSYLGDTSVVVPAIIADDPSAFGWISIGNEVSAPTIYAMKL